MDCVMNNMVERGDVVLIAENGIWGERAGDMASRHGEESSLIFALVQVVRTYSRTATRPLRPIRLTFPGALFVPESFYFEVQPKFFLKIRPANCNHRSDSTFRGGRPQGFQSGVGSLLARGRRVCREGQQAQDVLHHARGVVDRGVAGSYRARRVVQKVININEIMSSEFNFYMIGFFQT